MIRSLLDAARAAWVIATSSEPRESFKSAVHRRRLRVQLGRLQHRVQQLEFRMRDVEDRQAAGVDVDSFGQPQAEFEAVYAVADDTHHEVALCRVRFLDGTVHPYIRLRESHVQPPSERWFAVSTLVHLGLNVGDPEVWQVGNRPHRQGA